MLNRSHLYTFIDNDKKFALYFLEGQKLIHDLILTHELKSGGFSYFRSFVLSVQLMLGLLKHGEYFCFYIDSESPYFRLKIEMNAQGLMRGMMYSDHPNFSQGNISGQVRLVKFLPNSEMPYQSAIELQSVGISEILNLVLSRSYQIKSRIFVSENSDQSFMLHQLPLSSNEEPSDLDAAFTSYINSFQKIMSNGLTDQPSIVQSFEKTGFKYLASRPVEFKCGCSRKQMIENVKKFSKSSKEALFSPGKNFIEAVCEYCKTVYLISEKDMEGSVPDYQ